MSRATYIVTGLPTYTITYDPENRPLTIRSVWSATYRADGLRATKTGSGTTTYYLYDGGEPIIELNSSGTVTATNVYAPDGLVARNQPGVGWVMYAFDPQGNAAQRFSASGTVYAWTDYWLYGTASSTGPGISDTFGFEARYGYILDRELGWLHYCRNRYYENQSGRWLTRDPAGPAGGIDLYEYAGANPLRNIDPSGLQVPFNQLPGELDTAWFAHYNDPTWAPQPHFPPSNYNLATWREFAHGAAQMSPGFSWTPMTGIQPITYNGLWWFYSMVKTGGPMDFKSHLDRCSKQHKQQMTDFGNFNYGYIGAALGIDLATLLNQAGAAAIRECGKPQSDVNGPAHGDQPRDQYFIRQGYFTYTPGN